jgi:hypothetical protein
MVLLLFISQVIADNYKTWDSNSYIGTFSFFYFFGGIFYAGTSFKWLRSKESRFSYLMIPATSFEKFMYELIFKIIAFIVLVPFVYWFLANLEGTIFHLFAPEFKNFQFSFYEVSKSSEFVNNSFWENWTSINGLLLIFVIPFTGATYFKKNPMAKTLFSLAIIGGALFLYWLLLFKILGFSFHRHIDVKFEFLENNQLKNVLIGILLALVNITGFAIGYYNVKEKEV